MSLTDRILITGGTDGIGRASALAFARRGRGIDILGLDEERGQAVLKELQDAAPGAEHRLFIVDLASFETTNAFLKNYIPQTASLELLMLNANAFSNKVHMTGDGLERTFQVGAFSRLRFAVALDPLLRKSPNSRVLHTAAMHKRIAKAALNLRYEELRKPRYGAMWATWQSFASSALMVAHLQDHLASPVPHESFDPGIVATRQLTDQPKVLQWLIRLFADVREPEEIGEMLATHVEGTTREQIAGVAGRRGEPLAPLLDGERSPRAFADFCTYCEALPGWA